LTPEEYEKILTIVEKVEYTEVLLSISRGNTYSTKIADDLGKAQSTVTEELKILETTRLIFREERSKAQEFNIQPIVLYDFAITLLQKTLKSSHRFSMPVKQMREVFPKEVFMNFLHRYANDLLENPGRVDRTKYDPQMKNLIDLLFSFFDAIVCINLDSFYRLGETEQNQRLLSLAKMVFSSANQVAVKSVWGMLR